VRRRIGNREWNRRVRRSIEVFKDILHFDRVYVGGGNAKRLRFRRPDMRIVSNKAGVLGGIRLWHDCSVKRRPS
jgi:polyphosphate glucokinase